MALGIAAGARAHDYFFERSGSELVLRQGHEASAHEGEAAVPYDAGIVQDARCLDAEGRVRTLPKPAESPARFTGDCALLLVATSSGYWSETAEGTVNEPKTAATGALYSWSSEESIKLLERWLPPAAAPFGLGLELTPADDPLKLEPGDKLTVRVTWHGQPRAGVTVAYDGVPRGVTDAAGEINIRLRHGGRQLIAAGFDEPIESEQADRAVHATVLQFRIRE
jgi:nickel transport protein